MTDGSLVVEHLNELHTMLNQHTSLKIIFEDEIQSLLLLRSMLDNWNKFVVTISNATPKGNFFF